MLWFTFAGFLQKGMVFLATPIFTRMLTTAEYGLYSVFHAYLSVIAIVTTLSVHNDVLNIALVKGTHPKQRVVSAFQSIALVISAIFFVIAFIFRQQLAALMGLPVIVVVFIFLAFMFKEPPLIWSLYKRHDNEYKKPVIVSIAIAVLSPLIGVLSIFIFQDYKAEARIISYVMVSVIIPGAILYLVNYKRDKTFYDKDLWKYAVTFNAPLLIHYLSEMLFNQTDRIMINSYFGTSETGIYSVAYAGGSLVLVFSMALSSAMEPWVYQQLKAKNYKGISRASNIILLFLTMVIAVMFLLAPEIIFMLAGDDYDGAVNLIPTLASAVFYGYMYQIFSRVQLFYGKKHYTIIATVISALLNIVLNMWLMPIFGYQAAGYTTLISHIVFCVLHYFFYVKTCSECMGGTTIYSVKTLLFISAVQLSTAFVTTFLFKYTTLRFVIVGIVFVACLVSHKKLLGFAKTIMAR